MKLPFLSVNHLEHKIEDLVNNLQELQHALSDNFNQIEYIFNSNFNPTLRINSFSDINVKSMERLGY